MKLNQTITLTLRRVLFAGGILLGIWILLFCSFGVYFGTQLDKLWDAHNSRDIAPAAIASSVSVYTLREYEGKIGIYELGEATPFQVLDVFVFTLPEVDQAALRSGIRVYSSDALRALVEDFTG